MKKKGFTLVELLAVIAILAILVIIALPNIMELFNQAKYNSFLNEVKEIYKTAQSQFITDSMTSSREITYSKCSSGCSNPLKLSGRDNINYYIKFNKSGKVLNYIASDGTYQYSYVGSGLNVEEIQEAKELSKADNSEIISFNSSGANNIATFVTRQNSNAITPGDELKIAGENFYVVSSNSNETVLLAKYCIDIAQNKQVSGSNVSKTKFANNGYWDECNYSSSTRACTTSSTGLKSPYSNNGIDYCPIPTSSNPNPSPDPCAYVFDSNTAFYNEVNAYSSKVSSKIGLSVSGRLLKREESIIMDRGSSYAKRAVRSQNTGVYYWLGSPYDEKSVWSRLSDGVYQAALLKQSGIGIRPVIIINTSKL